MCSTLLKMINDWRVNDKYFYDVQLVSTFDVFSGRTTYKVFLNSKKSTYAGRITNRESLTLAAYKVTTNGRSFNILAPYVYINYIASIMAMPLTELVKRQGTFDGYYREIADARIKGIICLNNCSKGQN